MDSVGSLSPASESEITFSISSDNDNESVRSGSASLSGEPSIGKVYPTNGAIGSERKELKERSCERQPTDNHYTASSVSSEEGTNVGGKLVEVKADGSQDENERRKTPLLVLSSAEKRKSFVY